MPMAVEVMRRVITDSSRHQIAWVARDGVEAVAQCKSDKPDLVLMDLVMPNMDGVAATRQIMAESPCAILVVTATLDSNAPAVFEAMGAGALDVVQTPAVGLDGHAEGVAAFLYKIDATAKLIGDLAPAEESGNTTAETIVAIGASAGGPGALERVLTSLPANLPAAIIIVQHVDARFAPGLASWLGNSTKVPVKVATENESICSRTVYLAGTNDHLILRAGGHLGYTPKPENCSYRPSVDVFLESLSHHWHGNLVGVLLTGMGRDGAAGLKKLRDAGHHTIAQDRASSAVYGMPKAAAELNAAAEILSLERIGSAIRKSVEHPTPTNRIKK
jgi:chemotaxis response regulator CheB